MNYIDEASKKLAKSTNSNLVKFLSNFKNFNYYNTVHYHLLANLIGYTHGTNALMDFYMTSADEETKNTMNQDFKNFFARNQGKYFSIDVNNYPNLVVTFNHENVPFQIFTENFDDITSSHSFGNKNIFITFKILDEFIINDYHKYNSNIYSKNFKFLNSTFHNLLSGEKARKIVFETFISNHTLKIRDLILRQHNNNDEVSHNFFIQTPSHYSTLYIEKLGTMIYSFMDSNNQNSLQSVTELLNSMKFFDSKLINKFIKELSTWDSSSGNFKDLDEYNQSKLSVFTNYFDEKFDLIEHENLTSLRILRNLAKTKGVEINYVDERATVNSMTDEKLILFGDKVGCEIIIIDTKVLISRFPASALVHNIETPIACLFDFAKKERIFKNVVITPGKRAYKHILTVFCQKDKNHSEEALINLSETFSEAIFLFDSKSSFDDILAKIHREQGLKKTMEQEEKVMMSSSKQKI